MDYTFIVTVYNQEKLVIQTLESIKYQIITYGKKYQIQLVIGDDASTDNTMFNIEIWLKKNDTLFSEVNIFSFENNVGTCKNYTNSIQAIKGKCFKEIAGDDILPPNNIFKIMDMTKIYDVVAGVVIPFSKDVILYKKALYKAIISQSFYNEKQLKILTQVGCPIMNGSIWNKKLMTEDVLNYIKQYILIEDRPQWYKIFQENRVINYTFCENAVLLYRKETGSVTNGDTKINSIYQTDMNRIYCDIYSLTTSWLVKYSLCRKKSKSFLKVDPITIWIKWKRIIHYVKFFKIYRNVVYKHLEEYQEYLNYIIKKSNEFSENNLV